MSDLLKFDLLQASKAIKNKGVLFSRLLMLILEAIENTSSLGAYLEIVKDHALKYGKDFR